PDAGGRGGGLERGGREVPAARPKLVGERDGLPVTGLPLGLLQRALLEVDQQHVAHAVLPSAAGQGPDHQERLGAARHRLGERRVRRLVREVPLAGEEPHERPAAVREVVPDGAGEHGVGGLERVEHGALGDRALDPDPYLAVHPGEAAEVLRQHDPDHVSVTASTESTGGRSRTIGAQVSPASAETYTWPPVVPKYTPQGSSASTAVASRST